MAHLTLEQRYKIQTLREEDHSLKEIGDKICKDKSVISRKLKRKKHGGRLKLNRKRLPWIIEKFCRHQAITNELKVPIYFPHPYHSWDKARTKI